MQRIMGIVGLLLVLSQVQGVVAQELSTSPGPNGVAEADTESVPTRYHIVSRTAYADRLEGFWLGASIANWTGLVTEMDKIGDTAQFKTGKFYTRSDWGKPDLPNIWSKEPSHLTPVIGFVFRDVDEVWGSDDDTDIEYMYQRLLLVNENQHANAATDSGRMAEAHSTSRRELPVGFQ